MADYAPVLSDILAPTSGTMKSVKGLVVHHTGSHADIAGIVNYWTKHPFASGAKLGSTYIMDRDGTVYRMVPEGAKTNHASGYNSNYEGIEVIANDDSDITPAQIAAFKTFAEWHADNYGYTISPDTIVGHGEISDKKRETEGATLKWSMLASEGFAVPASVMVGDLGNGVPAMSFADAGLALRMPPMNVPSVASELDVTMAPLPGIPQGPSENLNALLPDDAMYGLRLDGKGLGLTQDELAQATGWGQGDQLYAPSGVGSLSDPRTIAMMTPQQRLATIAAAVSQVNSVFTPLQTLPPPPIAFDGRQLQTLPAPPMATLDDFVPYQPTPAAPFSGSRPAAPVAPVPATMSDELAASRKATPTQTALLPSGTEVKLGVAYPKGNGGIVVYKVGPDGKAMIDQDATTHPPAFTAGKGTVAAGIVGDVIKEEGGKAIAAAGEAVTGAADAVKDKAGEIVGGVGGFLGDLLKPRAGVTTGDTGAQSPPTMMTKAPAPSISSKIILPLSMSSALDFPSLGLTSAAKPPVISTPAAVVPYFGETMNIPPIPQAAPVVAAPAPAFDFSTFYSSNAPATGLAAAGAAGAGGAVASTVLAAPVVAAPPVVMRPVVRDNSPIATGDYTIRWGDTLASISARSGFSVADLAAQNGIGNINSIAEGQRLRIGMQPKAVAPTGPLNRGRPVVKSASEIAGEKLRSQGYTVTGNNLGFVSNGRDGFSAGALIPTKVMANRIAKGY